MQDGFYAERLALQYGWYAFSSSETEFPSAWDVKQENNPILQRNNLSLSSRFLLHNNRSGISASLKGECSDEDSVKDKRNKRVEKAPKVKPYMVDKCSKEQRDNDPVAHSSCGTEQKRASLLSFLQLHQK